LRNHPENLMARDNLAKWLIDQGRLPEAREQCRQALVFRADDPEAQWNLARINLREGKPEEAAEDCLKSIAARPRDAQSLRDAWGSLSEKEATSRTRFRPLSVRWKSSLICLKPGAIWALPFAQERRLPEAIRADEKALQLAPDYALAHNDLGGILRQMGRTDDALPHFRRATELEPDFGEAHYNIADILLRQGHTNEALAEYQKAAELPNPRHARGWRKSCGSEGVAKWPLIRAGIGGHGALDYCWPRITLLAYQPAAWRGGFVWDDDVYVTNNKLLTAPDGLRRIWFSLDSPSQYFPLVYTVFRVEHRFWGLTPHGYHWVNLLLHTANVLLLWRLLRRLGLPACWLAAALFAVASGGSGVGRLGHGIKKRLVFVFLFACRRARGWSLSMKLVRRWWFYAAALLCQALALTAKTTVLHAASRASSHAYGFNTSPSAWRDSPSWRLFWPSAWRWAW
jgi:tetratricopeptide (TPR) repeat protein